MSTFDFGADDAKRRYTERLNAAFERDDYEWFARQCDAVYGSPVPANVAVEAFHKARMICGATSRRKREISRRWLALRGCHYEDGRPITEKDDLP